MASRSGSVAEAALADPPKRDITIPIGAVVTKAEAAPPQRQRVTYVTAAFAEADAARKAAFGPELLQLWPETCSPPLPAGAAGRAPRSAAAPRAASSTRRRGASRRRCRRARPSSRTAGASSPASSWTTRPTCCPGRRPRSRRAPGARGASDALERRGVSVTAFHARPPPRLEAPPPASGPRRRGPPRPPPPPPEPAAEQLPPAVGSRVRVHVPENDDRRPPAWFPATVVRVDAPPPKRRPSAGAARRSPRKKPKGAEVEIRYDDDGSIDVLRWPDDAADVRVDAAAAWDPGALEAWRSCGKKRKRGAGAPTAPLDAAVAPCVEETRHLLHFALLQLRAEYAEIVARVCREGRAGGGGDDPGGSLRVADAVDLASCEPLMEAFLLGGCARGDKWMPWHCALGAHERYLLEVVYALPRLESDRDRYILGYAFSGSREIELFERILRPLFEADASDDDAALGRSLLDDPHAALRRDGELHRRYAAYRAEDKKLHTTAYLCHPPRGSSGDEFVCYIIDRTARFVVLGARIYALLRAKLGDGFEAWAATHRPAPPAAAGAAAPPAAPPPSLGGPDLKLSLEQALLQEDEIGPTMTKMFLVSTHLAYPAAKILDGSCAVGDGAEAAFDYLYPGVPPRSRSVHRGALLSILNDALGTPAKVDALEPRLLPMLRFVAAAARARFGSMFAPVVSESITPYDLQVNLCEWRKFRTKVDRKRLCRRVLDRGRASARGRKQRKSPSAALANVAVPASYYGGSPVEASAAGLLMMHAS
ncbi:hypothetical protein JL722_3348 [Aureococcus anophagefferens]|nr:hypothetical protein JL722_3348 [Aureococcus anophagefferens]